MWKKSFEFLNDHLSPEMVEKYGPAPPKSSTEIDKISAVCDQPESAALAEGGAGTSGGDQIPEE